MGLFEKKECILCGGKAGLITRYKIVSGDFICGNCRNLMSDYTDGIGSMTLDEIKEQIRLKEENDRRYREEFDMTRQFSLDNSHPIMAVDDTHGEFAMLKGENPDIFSFDHIAAYDLDLNTSPLTDEEKQRRDMERKGGLAGFLEFLLSDDYSTRYPDLPRVPRDHKIMGMHFNIELGKNPFCAKRIRIDLMQGWADRDTRIERAFMCANDIYQCIKEYKSGAHTVSGRSTVQTAPAAGNAYEQVKQLKELLDIGAVTQEEFDIKKKQLLGL